MGVCKDDFYDPKVMAILSMGFCFRGTSKSGDFPPRREFAPLWRISLMERLNRIESVLAMGKYALDYHLLQSSKAKSRSVTEAVKVGCAALHVQRAPMSLGLKVPALPHPSLRYIGWLKKTPWFEQTLMPELEARVKHLLSK